MCMQVEGLINDKNFEIDLDNVEQLLRQFQIVQRSMEKDTVILSDAWFIEQQMEEALRDWTGLPADVVDQIVHRWKDSVSPAQTRQQALCVMLDPRILELERIGRLELGDSLTSRGTNAFDVLCRQCVPDELKPQVRYVAHLPAHLPD